MYKEGFISKLHEKIYPLSDATLSLTLIVQSPFKGQPIRDKKSDEGV